jgi:hypothetical protein
LRRECLSSEALAGGVNFGAELDRGRFGTGEVAVEAAQTVVHELQCRLDRFCGSSGVAQGEFTEGHARGRCDHVGQHRGTIGGLNHETGGDVGRRDARRGAVDDDVFRGAPEGEGFAETLAQGVVVAGETEAERVFAAAAREGMRGVVHIDDATAVGRRSAGAAGSEEHLLHDEQRRGVEVTGRARADRQAATLDLQAGDFTDEFHSRWA